MKQVQCSNCDCVMDLTGSYVSETEIETSRSSGSIGRGTNVSVYNVFGKGGPKLRVGGTSSRSLERKSYKTVKVYYCQDCAMMMAKDCRNPGQLIVDKRKGAPELADTDFTALGRTFNISGVEINLPKVPAKKTTIPNAQLVYQATRAAVLQAQSDKWAAEAKAKQEAYDKLSSFEKGMTRIENYLSSLSDTGQTVAGFIILGGVWWVLSRFF